MGAQKTLDINSKNEGWLIHVTRGIERVGNKMPHPVYLFLILTIFFMLLSCGLSLFGVSAVKTTTGANGVSIKETISVVNMLSPKQLVEFLSSMLTDYKNLAATTLLLMVVMGVALAEHSGFFSAILRKSLLSAPRCIITYALCVVGICANICGDAGMVLGASLGCMVYKAIGRNPWVGGITGYAAAAAGYTANLIPASVDANLSSITQEIINSMNIINPITGELYNVHALSNYFFMFAATFVLAAVVAIVSETYLVKFLGDRKTKPSPEELEQARPTEEENRGLKWAGIATLLILAIILWGSIPANGVFRDAVTGNLLPKSPLMSSIIPLIFICFTIIGSAYGVGAGVIKKAKDIPNIMIKGVSDMSAMWVIFLFVSMMLHIFNTSNLATVISIIGEHFLSTIGLTGLPLLLVFAILVMIINLFMYSASSKWLLLSPVFIPMFANLGINPAITQIAYRMGDSCTNSITPLNACLIAMVSILNNYKSPEFQAEGQEAGVGTIISTVSVFCIAMFITFLIFFSIWYLLGLPFGIGA